MLARLVAAAWRGLGARDQMDQATAEKVGKRLHKQVETKVRRLLADASSRAARARAALSRASLEGGLESLSEKTSAINAQEQEDLAAIRRTEYK
eukprot:7388070-Prymnesium_polylepis.1